MNKRIHSGDFLVCASILTSGNNYGKLALWAKMLGLKLPSADQFHGIQATYMIPTIDYYWKDHQKSVIDSFSGKPVVVMGDGRNDSPGHCAQYCSYTIMEQTSKKILTLITLDKRTTDRKSVNMEKVGFAKAMEEMKAKNIEVEEVVTDAHLGIGAIMKTSYPDIKHSHDIWHAAKSLGKRLLKVAQKKSNAVLGKWTKDIVNHFWFACKEASTYEQFVSIWRSVLHHITNQHSWILPHGDGETTCRHGLLSDEDRNKPWLDPRKDCAVLKELASVVMDKRFLGKVHYYLNFRSTADLEGFHQLILMYAAKRFAYTPAVYRIRNELAALDHNNNADIPNIVNKDGTLRLQRTWNKKSSRWTAHPKKSEKNYTYVKDILRKALVMRIKDSVGMRKKRELEADDPRRIAAHLAPVEPLPTKVLMEEKVSRFK
ncbi:uncharacterized protein LOC132713139 [Ruditapes philippinarum]|uniref:uncharacterized protein LOC132713139 n=1 Tax=Ruditapes philippinarum TaxID=129788 RepID=UPI00295AE500|nr:uncharacterized protein LOC132713139 [Ruditapes philippinarum]